ncbi:MAG: radical SAM protein [Chloroflexi bacterium]|nr:radical SAM protein [Chloroflexota bacterium]
MFAPGLISSVNIAITGRCNLRCRYCFYADEMVAFSDLPTASWLAFFKELAHQKVMTVTLTGGEVFTRADLFEIIDGVVENHMRYSLLTNATLVDEKTIQKFDVGKRRLRLNSIQVSVDGSSSEIHDRSRPHSFTRTMRGLRLLQQAGFPVTVRTTINRHNYLDLENIANLLLNELQLSSFSTNEAMPIGAGCDNQGDVSLTSPEKAQTMEILAGLLDRFPGRITSSAGPLTKLKMYAEMEHARKTGELASSWQMGSLSACGCIFSTLDVLHDGRIVPCHMLSDLSMGNITTHSIEEIWKTHPFLTALRSRRAIPMSQVSGCEHCSWTSYCNGSCPGLAYQLTGDFNRANPEDCYNRFLSETKQ